MYSWHLARPQRLKRALWPINQPYAGIWIPQFKTGVSGKGKIQRALSIRQPYVEAILRGEKTEEYRSRNTRIRERVYLYASKTKEEDFVYDDFGIEKEEVPHGCIVGSVEIVNVSKDEDEDEDDESFPGGDFSIF